jgi:predicted Rossmann fold nucleotide-binding protein DprA/Smf involved in DNA uptake
MTVYGISGTRTYTDYVAFKKSLQYVNDITHIVSGGANGTDTMAERYAKENGIPITIIRADWKTYGKRAGPLRNREIVGRSEIILAYWDYKSSGTKSTIDISKELGKPCYVVDIRG